MKNTAICVALVLLIIAIFIPISCSFALSGPDFENVRTTRQSRSRTRSNENIGAKDREETKQKRVVRPVEVAGSRLPDCSHACGSCSPCKLVIVSSMCESVHEAETCPVSYRCICNHKSYPVP